MTLRRPAPHLVPLVEEVHRLVLGRGPAQPPRVELYPYAEGRSTVREEGGRLRFTLNALLGEAPEDALRGVVGVLLCRIRRRDEAAVPAAWARAYRTFLAERPPPARPPGRKHIEPVGAHRSLLEAYLRVTLDLGLAVPQVPRLSWSQTVAGHRFGHWDPDHNVVVISQILDDPAVPEFVLDYVVYHELLHLVHPVRMGSGSRRIVHSAAFRRDERRFPRWKEGDEWIDRLARRHRRERQRRR